jgi:hypothetical protein
MEENKSIEIATVRIFPGIGIARVGNSPDEYFIGPESPLEQPNSSGKFKDKEGRIKRQAARFRIYGYDKDGNSMGEITGEQVTIQWTVHLANKKSSYYMFAGRFNQKFTADNLRNQVFQDPDKRMGPKDFRQPDERAEWINDPGDRTISGINSAPVYFNNGKIKDVLVPLGEIRTDDKGRLLVLGGHGKSASLVPANPLHDYANNDNWYDDTSDGPIHATVTIKNSDGTEKKLTADSAWVLVTPPKFAPNHYNLVSLYDRVRERSEEPATDNVTKFYRDIYPILYRAANYAWVNGMSYRAHGAGKNGNFLNSTSLRILADNNDFIVMNNQRINCKEYRMRVFQRIRKPVEWKITDGKVIIENQADANQQANYKHMPQLSGDNGDAVEFPISPMDTENAGQIPALTWLTVLPSQYAHLANWANGHFQIDTPDTYQPLEEYPINVQAAALDRGVLEYCVGGPFFPGIEMTFVADEKDTFRAPFRIAEKFKAGDITRYMALPWQADFFECNTHWWPAQRPDNIVTEESYAEVQKLLEHYNFVQDPINYIDPQTVYASAMADRVFWARGISDNPNDFKMGDNNMAKYWHEMGFVTKRLTPGIVCENKFYREEVYVEQERHPFAGMPTDRELFYMLQNIDNFPGLLPKVREYVDGWLQLSADYGDAEGTPEQQKYFVYTPQVFEDRMMDIYNSLVENFSLYDPATDPIYTSRKDCIQRVISLAPFNLTDGGWLRHIDKAGPTDQVQSFLSSIFQDERGNGDPSMNHCNIYLDLCHSVGFYPKPVDSEAFAQDPIFMDSGFTVPAFELAISQFTESYYPEILGMTLQLEWEVIELKSTIELFRYYGLNTHFYVMHVGIDNAVNGHGRRAIDAIKLYLDGEIQLGGEKAVQEKFRRIWTGFIAFGFVGNLGSDLRDQNASDPSLKTRMVNMINSKAAFGSLNHDKNMIGGKFINDYFSEPISFLQALQDAGYIVPGDVAGSKFFSLLDFQTGPMYRVFTDDEKQLWKDWTMSLVEQPKPTPVNPYEAMVKLIQTLKGRQAGNPEHAAIEIKQPGTDIGHTISWWFDQPAEAFMEALAYEKNKLIVPNDPDNSIFVTQLISPTNAMGQAFDSVIPGTAGLTGRKIVIDWIDKGCPLAAKYKPSQLKATALNEKVWLSTPAVKLSMLKIRKIYGMGTIH